MAMMIDLRGSSANMENLLRIRSGPANRLKETVQYIRNTLYFNSKHALKMLGGAMQKAQDLHIKHLYTLGEDQQDQ